MASDILGACMHACAHAAQVFMANREVTTTGPSHLNHSTANMSAILTTEGSCGPVTPPQPRMAATMAHGSAPPVPSAAAASTSTRIPVASGGVQKRTGQHAAEAVRM